MELMITDDSKGSSPYISNNRMFDHFKVTILFENLLYSEVREKTFYIPIINSDECVTAWNLRAIFEVNCINIELHRNFSNIEPELVYMSCRFGFKHKNREIWIKQASLHFDREYIRSEYLENVSKYMEGRKLEVLCQILAKGQIMSPKEICLTPLYSDIFRLYDNEMYTDLKLDCLDGSSFKVHKSIISAKSLFLRGFFSDEDNGQGTFELSDYASDLKTLLAFIYSGNLNFALKDDVHPPITLYDFAAKYQVKELTDLLLPTEITIEVKCEVFAVDFIWDIQQFSEVNLPEFRREYLLVIEKWEFRLCLIPSSVKGFISLIIESFEDHEEIVLYLKYSVLDENRTLHFSQEYQGSLEKSSPFCVENFLKKELIFNSPFKILPEDVLSLQFKIEASNYESETQHEDKIDNDAFRKEKSELITGFGDLIDWPHFDFELLPQHGKSFRIHRAILNARCSFFLTFPSDKLVYKFNELSWLGLNSFVKFIYTGKLDDISAFELYQVKEKYPVSKLTEEIHELNQRNCTVETICHLLLKLDELGLDNLMDHAMHFFCCNFAEVSERHEWTELIKLNVKLANNLLKKMADCYIYLKQKKKTSTLMSNQF